MTALPQLTVTGTRTNNIIYPDVWQTLPDNKLDGEIMSLSNAVAIFPEQASSYLGVVKDAASLLNRPQLLHELSEIHSRIFKEDPQWRIKLTEQESAEYIFDNFFKDDYEKQGIKTSLVVISFGGKLVGGFGLKTGTNSSAILHDLTDNISYNYGANGTPQSEWDSIYKTDKQKKIAELQKTLQNLGFEDGTLIEASELFFDKAAVKSILADPNIVESIRSELRQRKGYSSTLEAKLEPLFKSLQENLDHNPEKAIGRFLPLMLTQAGLLAAELDLDPSGKGVSEKRVVFWTVTGSSMGNIMHAFEACKKFEGTISIASIIANKVTGTRGLERIKRFIHGARIISQIRFQPSIPTIFNRKTPAEETLLVGQIPLDGLKVITSDISIYNLFRLKNFNLKNISKLLNLEG